MNERGMTPAEAEEEIVVVCRAIRATTDTCRELMDWFLRYFVDGEGEEPPREAYLDRVLNPKQNGTSVLLKRLREALGVYLPGTLSSRCVEALCEMTNDALSFVEMLQGFFRTESLEDSYTTESDILGYMTVVPTRLPTWPKHRLNLRQKFGAMKASFYENSRRFSTITTQILERSKMPRKTSCSRNYKDILKKLDASATEDFGSAAPVPVYVVGGMLDASKTTSGAHVVSVRQLLDLLSERCARENLADKVLTARTIQRWESGDTPPRAGYTAACRDSIPAALAWIDAYIAYCRAAVTTERVLVSFDERYHSRRT